MSETTVYREIARAFDAFQRCKETGNDEWEIRWSTRIETLVDNYLPSGSGFDSGAQFDFDESRVDRLVFHTSYHHMDKWGGYCEWSDYSVIVYPDACFGFRVRVTDRDYRGTKEYIAEQFTEYLSRSKCDCCQLQGAVSLFLSKDKGFAELRESLAESKEYHW